MFKENISSNNLNLALNLKDNYKILIKIPKLFNKIIVNLKIFPTDF